jgi:predicted nucleic acid-binding protein
MSSILIVADASPLISAARAGELSLVEKVYPSLVLPSAVYHEIVSHGSWRPGADEIQKAQGGWIQVHEVGKIQEVEILMAKFGRGESEAIALAEELGAILYADEGAVISEARTRGIAITSTLIMLMEAKQRKLIPNVKSVLDKFIMAGLRISEELYQFVLTQAGEE